LNLASKLINHLGILSPNETLEDINTSDLRCLLVDALSGQLSLLAKTKGGKERITYLNKASVSSFRELAFSSLAKMYRISQDYFKKYSSLVEQYEIVPQDQRAAYQGVSASEMDSARRRAGKIAQFKREKEIKSKLEVMILCLFHCLGQQAEEEDFIGITETQTRTLNKTNEPHCRFFFDRFFLLFLTSCPFTFSR